MKQQICLVLALVLMFFITGCSKEPSVVGIWEEEITISVLGQSGQQEKQPGILRYTFSEDGTGTQEVIPNGFPEQTHADTFTYRVDGDKLIMTVTSTMQGEVSFEYTIKDLTSDSLELYFYGVTNNLKRVK